jgi:lipopolysaccharide export system permease protein
MILVYKKYILKKFFISFIKVFFVFILITLIMNLLEELSFFKEEKKNILLPIYLTLLNLPSIIFEIFPFIFFIGTIYFFLELIELNEINTFKQFGITNFQIIKFLSIVSLILGILIITIYYNFSTSMKYIYLNIKNDFSKDDKYLAAVTTNGLWIKDVIDNKTNYINAEKISGKYLLNLSVIEFDKNFNVAKTITANKANLENQNWILYNVKINSNNSVTKFDNINFKSNFDIYKITTIFENLSSLNLFEIELLKKEYELLGYSSKSINSFKHKIYSYPLYLSLMVILGAVIMLNFKYNNSKIFYIIIGVLISVIIYFINYFFGIVIDAKEASYLISIWGPQLILLTIVLIRLVKINEK